MDALGQLAHGCRAVQDEPDRLYVPTYNGFFKFHWEELQLERL